jgi:hypothetical protein
MHELLGAPMLAAYQASNEWTRQAAQAQLDAQDFSRAWQAGHALTFDEAIQLALRDEPKDDSKSHLPPGM